ncbi:MAG TPA: hypothetical protein DDZ51_11410 [Planctomycetaceae bacterium]|nr:hypothetical protein [Planctomycetaceae bacterium]
MKCRSEKRLDALRRGKKANEIDSPPKGQNRWDLELMTTASTTGHDSQMRYDDSQIRTNHFQLIRTQAVDRWRPTIDDPLNKVAVRFDDFANP